MYQEKLWPRELLAITILLSFLLVLTRFSWHTPDDRWPKIQGKKIPKPVEKIVVTIKGAVEQAGHYHFDKGTKLEDALKKIKLTEEADLSKIDLEKTLKVGQKLIIPKKKIIKEKKVVKKQ